MALEITGLTIGALALVGTFKDCIDVFGMILSARSLTDDAELLNTKLDVEKLLLLQWADRVRLTEPKDYDRRLDDPDLNRTIARVLESIKRLLGDGKALRDRYGLVDYQAVRHEIALDDKLEVRVTASSTRLQQFTERLNRLSLHNEVSRTGHSATTRFKWVVRDKEKFSNLMDELSYFVSRLDALVPAQEQFGSAMTEKDLAMIRSIPQLKVIIKVCTGVQPQMAVIAQQIIQSLNQERVLDRLWFRTIDDRKTNINERHFRTLNWALDPLETTLKWDNLAEWLRNGSGLYWLAGKAGSGKSTLMKYLSNHPQTTSLLKQWAGQSELVTLRFFFYALGRFQQKSQEGILRSLLFQFLDQHRDLIEHVLPAMWKEAIITEDKDHDLAMPSISEMQNSFLQFLGAASADTRFWILIDGLDEFEGKHASIAAFISKLERLANVKVLVSSRPLPVFVSAFDHTPKMYLQDLTKKDIENYINDTLWHHPHMARLSHIEPREVMEIAEVLVSKACGVFLWVVLACQSILEGLEEYDTTPELMSRANEIPPELGDFFRQMIDGIDPRKRDRNARFLRLIFESQTRSAFAPIPTLGFAIVDEQGLRADFMGPNVAELSNEERVLRCRTLEGRLRSRCSGLLEIQVDSDVALTRQSEPITAEDASIVNSHVVFLHRSLFEFLCTEGMWEQDALRVDNECGRFEPHAILASLWTQLASLYQRQWPRVDAYYTNALIHNKFAAAVKCPPEILATNLSRLQVQFFDNEPSPFPRHRAELWLPHQPECRKGCENLSAGLAIAAELGMVSVVRLALEDPDEVRRALVQPEMGQVRDCSSFVSCPTRLYGISRARLGTKYTSRSTVFPPLYHATCRPLQSMMNSLFTTARHYAVSTEVVKYLLQNGHDPNEKFCTGENSAVYQGSVPAVPVVDEEFRDEVGVYTTPWVQWLYLISQDISRSSHSGLPYPVGFFAEQAHQQAAFTKLLVDAGAELGAPGTHMQELVDKSVSNSTRDTAWRGGGTVVAWARSDDLWSKLRDKIRLSRTAGSHRDAHSD